MPIVSPTLDVGQNIVIIYLIVRFFCMFDKYLFILLKLKTEISAVAKNLSFFT